MKSKNNLQAFLFLIFIFCATKAAAYDFSLMSTKCELLVSYPKLSEGSLKHVTTDKTILICSRNEEGLVCITKLEGGEGDITMNYAIQMDSPPYLVFGSDDGSVFVVVDTSEIAASYTARVMADDFMGAKVCNMTYWTREQQEALDKVLELMNTKPS